MGRVDSGLTEDFPRFLGLPSWNTKHDLPMGNRGTPVSYQRRNIGDWEDGKRFRDRVLALEIAREVEGEVANFYYGPRATTREVIIEIARAAKMGEVPKPWRLPAVDTLEQKWGVAGVIAMSAHDWWSREGLVIAGEGQSVLVVADDPSLVRSVRQRFDSAGWSAQDLIMMEAGYAGVVSGSEFERMLASEEGRVAIGRCQHVLAGGFRDYEAPCRLAQQWYSTHGWGDGQEEAAERLMSLTDRQTLDLVSWGRYWMLK